jgi:thioesterase domain-containing protein
VWRGGAGRGAPDDFFALGGTSLQVIRLMAKVGERFGRDLPLETIFRGATITELARALRAGSRGSSSPLVPLRAGGRHPPLVCFPPAVGTTLCYLELTRALPAAWPVHGVHAPGLNGDRPTPDLDEQVARYAGAIAQAWPCTPVVLVGYCIGTVVAVEVARRLRASGHDVPVVALIDGGPALPGAAIDQAGVGEIAAWFALELGKAAGRVLDVPVPALAGLGQEGIARAVWEHAVAADVLPPDTRVSDVRGMLDTFVANVRAVQGHSVEPFDGDVVTFSASESPPEGSPAERWWALASAGVRTVEVPGDHYTMLRPPHVARLAAALDAELRAAVEPVDLVTEGGQP